MRTLRFPSFFLSAFLICGLSPRHLWSFIPSFVVFHRVICGQWQCEWSIGWKLLHEPPYMVITLLGFEVSSCMKPKAKWRSVDGKNIWHNIYYIFIILLIINYLYLTNTLPSHFLPPSSIPLWNLEFETLKPFSRLPCHFFPNPFAVSIIIAIFVFDNQHVEQLNCSAYGNKERDTHERQISYELSNDRHQPKGTNDQRPLVLRYSPKFPMEIDSVIRILCLRVWE